MNVHARDAAISACLCAVVITALLVTGSLDVLWLLLLVFLYLAMF